MAKSRLRPNRRKYPQYTNKEWLFDKKSNNSLVVFVIFLALMAILGLIGAFLRYYNMVVK
ncbi:hypothetical protein SAMN05444008_12057 [Cnuella takakiae]|uniref:Uncharacterized protein n=1 Tax=Cnuella takakiae TaxID=1302690 RepID=A0A1M5HTV8_9BACT|nr:hypothetical protein BUE76_00170 [Cnuella takakiae]SHG19384.1 hypothetical protein SAMN05444008_12057 [Cnuella takakiae]